MTKTVKRMKPFTLKIVTLVEVTENSLYYLVLNAIQAFLNTWAEPRPKRGAKNQEQSSSVSDMYEELREKGALDDMLNQIPKSVRISFVKLLASGPYQGARDGLNGLDIMREDPNDFWISTSLEKTIAPFFVQNIVPAIRAAYTQVVRQEAENELKRRKTSTDKLVAQLRGLGWTVTPPSSLIPVPVVTSHKGEI